MPLYPSFYALAEERQREKLLGLYVDVVDGKVRSPQDLEVDQERVRQTVELLTVHVRLQEKKAIVEALTAAFADLDEIAKEASDTLISLNSLAQPSPLDLRFRCDD